MGRSLLAASALAATALGAFAPPAPAAEGTIMFVEPVLFRVVWEPGGTPGQGSRAFTRFEVDLQSYPGRVTLGGKLVTFSIEGDVICTDVTRANGRALCPMTDETRLQAIQAGGWDATFAGDNDHLGTTKHASLIKILGKHYP